MPDCDYKPPLQYVEQFYISQYTGTIAPLMGGMAI